MLIVSITTEKRLSTTQRPCVEDPNYNYFKCIESYFYEQRGCQYPWNVYEDLNLRVCTNSEIYSIPYFKDRSKGYKRHLWSKSHFILMTRNKCPPPCSMNHYDVVFEDWNLRGDEFNTESLKTSLQIAFEDFISTHKEEYLSCDTACILGEVGGNLGFFLGGSILLGLDAVIKMIMGTATVFCKKRSISLSDSATRSI